MKQAKNVLLAFLISPEIIGSLFVCFVFFLCPVLFEGLGRRLKVDPEIWKYPPALIVLFSGLSFKFSSKIRAPLDGASNRALYEWPLYPLLVARVMVGLFFAVISGAIGLWVWIYGQSFSNEIIGCLIIITIWISAATAFTMMLACQKLRELVGSYGS